MALTLRQVRYFIATAEFGQISQAAIHLNISQSAVTSAIQELEGMLGVALFTRTAQGMNLTDSGRTSSTTPIRSSAASTTRSTARNRTPGSTAP